MSSFTSSFTTSIAKQPTLCPTLWSASLKTHSQRVKHMVKLPKHGSLPRSWSCSWSCFLKKQLYRWSWAVPNGPLELQKLLQGQRYRGTTDVHALKWFTLFFMLYHFVAPRLSQYLSMCGPGFMVTLFMFTKLRLGNGHFFYLTMQCMVKIETPKAHSNFFEKIPCGLLENVSYCKLAHPLNDIVLNCTSTLCRYRQKPLTDGHFFHPLCPILHCRH
jgi:hypothetical protein